MLHFSAMLTHRGMEAWLEGPKGVHLAHGPSVVDENQISAVIQVENEQRYHLRWRRVPEAPPVDAWCEIFRPSGKHGNMKIVRIANDIMASNDDQTQSRSTKRRLELPLLTDAWLWTTRSPGAFVVLKIRRLRRPPTETSHRGPRNSMVYEMDTDLIDDEDEGIPPYIVFLFTFQTTQQSDEKVSPASSSRMPGRDTHYKGSSTSVRVPTSQSDFHHDDSESSVLTSPEPSGPQSAVVRGKRKRDDHGEGPAEAAAILKKRQTVMQEIKDIEEKRKKRKEAKKLKQAQHDSLLKALREDLVARQAELVRMREEQEESEQMDREESEQMENEIRKMREALHPPQ
ncbi:hypothetical protein B0H10DRAFT_2022414 [Mycena sp. CBHHK59/15]|nr:hypothetical protein B0H10DRAFT_2022414 [Mycena sp. CBHHK59/15]